MAAAFLITVLLLGGRIGLFLVAETGIGHNRSAGQQYKGNQELFHSLKFGKKLHLISDTEKGFL